MPRIGFLVAIAVIAAACASPPAGTAAAPFQGMVVDPPQPKPDFVLTDTTGRRFDFRADTDGRLTLLYFGYTYCPDICPVQLAQIAAVLDQLPDVRRNTTVVFVTVDPERDTPEVIRSFLDKFDTDFIGLTGTASQIAAAQQAAGLPVATKIGDGPDYTMGHSGQVLAYTPGGLMYTEYPFGTRQTQWASDLPKLLER